MKFVVIVDEGQEGLQSRARGDYEECNTLILRALDARPGQVNEQFVQVAKTTKKALVAIARCATDDNSVLVFTTRDMFYEAKRIQAARPQLRVVLVPEAPAEYLLDQGVTIISRARLSSGVGMAREALQKAILG